MKELKTHCKNGHLLQSNKRSFGGQSGRCYICIKNDRNMRNYKRYGITVDRYNEMLYIQEHKCAICLRHVNQLKRKLHVDHNHKTGEVRALLCSNCNTSIGLLYECGMTAYRLAMYLQGPNFN